METSSNTGSTSSVVRFEYASFWTRFLATLVDILVLIIPGAMISSAIPYLGTLVVVVFYYVALEAGPAQATIGKRVMKIKVVRKDGTSISVAQAFVRRLISSLSMIMLGAGHLFAFFTEKKQALHDIVADTFVVHGDSETSIPDGWVAGVRKMFGVQ